MNDPSPIAFEARGAAGGSSGSRTAEVPHWGTRFVEERAADGSVTWREVELTWEDLLDPQEGDLMVHGTLHGQVICVTAVMLRNWFESQGRNDVLVTDDVKMIWGVPGLSNVGPDIAVIPDVADPKRPRGSFKVAEEGTRPVLVIEVISKSTRSFDYKTKPGIYEQAGVRECFFVDPLTTPWRLSGRRSSQPGGRYAEVRLNAQGWLISTTTGLRFRVGEDGESLEIEDTATGERLRNLSEETVARKAAERRTAQFLVTVLEQRGLELDEPARQRILGCQDPGQLERWMRHAFTVDDLDDLFRPDSPSP